MDLVLKLREIRRKRGLSVAHRRALIAGVHLSGARIASLSLVHGRLVIRLRGAASSLRVTVGPPALRETRGLRAKAELHKLGRLVLTLITLNTAGKRSTLRVPLNHPARYGLNVPQILYRIGVISEAGLPIHAIEITDTGVYQPQHDVDERV